MMDHRREAFVRATVAAEAGAMIVTLASPEHVARFLAGSMAVDVLLLDCDLSADDLSALRSLCGLVISASAPRTVH